ncbi:MAG: AraC family transcriptional regulator [Defluviitaleaceae bacterium]|nr:AraC family transcriptional regulator [Defluviitaleaceae bacterium]
MYIICPIKKIWGRFKIISWIDRLNDAVWYIDENLDGEIDYGEISRITVSPAALFQRFFVMATGGVTLAEYIRRRKMSRALDDLQKNGARVTDTAIKYGYESADAFCVAFKRLFGVTPSQAKISGDQLKRYDRIYFSLTVSHVKDGNGTALLNVDEYRCYDPLFEGARIILNMMGENFTTEYVQGISGSAFKIAGGCPSCPTSVYDMWPHKLIRLLGYETKHYPCFDKSNADVTAEMVEAVKKSVDCGRPALVWNAFSVAEYDVVCGYNNDTKQFIGRCAAKGAGDYAREPWDRAKTCSCAPVFGAIIVGEKKSAFDENEAERMSIINAVKHAKSENSGEGLKFYRKWIKEYTSEGKERGVADAYCYDMYSSVRKAAPVYLHALAYKHDGSVSDMLHFAAACFEKEAAELEKARPFLSWNSNWGVDEARSKSLAPILKEAAEQYKKGMEYLGRIVSKWEKF